MRFLKQTLKAFFVLSATVSLYLGCGGSHHSPPAPVTPVVTAPTTVTTGKTGLTASVTAQAGMSYAWTVSSGTITAGQGTIQITFTAGAVGTTTVSCTVSNSDGTAATPGTAQVTVVAAATASLMASTASPLYGATNVTVTPTFTGATSAMVGTSQGASDISVSPTSGTAIAVQTGGFTTAKTYWVRATNAANDFVDSVPVTVTPQTVLVSALSPATVSLTVGTTQSFGGGVVTNAVNTAVTWSVDGLTGGNAAVGTISAAGLYTAGSTTGSHTIKATAVADGTTYQAATVTVVPLPVTPTITAPATVTAGKSGLTASITPQAGMSYLWALSSGSITAGQGTAQITFTAGAVGTATVSCTVTNALSVSATAGTLTVTSVAAATASVAASTTSPLYGATNVTVTPTFAGAASAMVGTSQGASDISASPTSGTAIAVQAGGFTTARTYWVRATNAAGDFVDSLPVTVTPQTVTVSAVTPATANLTVGFTQSFGGGVVTNAVNTTVTWSVDGVTGGNAAVGTISAAGLYTAGTTTGAHTIKATAVADGTTFKTATATVYGVPLATGLVAAKGTITTGTATTVTPTFSNGTATIGTSGIGSSDLSGSATNNLAVSTGVLTSTKTYTLTVTNGAGAQASTTVTVTVVAAATASIGASITSPLYGATDVTVTPSFTGETSAIVGTALDASDISTTPVSGTPIPVQTGGFTVAKTYYLRVTNAAGDNWYSSIAVTPLPVVVSPVTPANSTITASTSQVFSSSVSGALNAGITWSATGGAGSWSGSTWTAPATPGNYTITATSAADGTKFASTGVTVAPVPITAIITTPSSTVTTSKTGLTASVTNPQSLMTYLWSITNGAITSATNSTSITYTAGAVGTTTLSCVITNAAGLSAAAGTLPVTVVAAPVAASLLASNPSPLYGDTVTLTPTFSGGIAVIDHSITSNATNGTPYTTAAITAATTYTLTVTNAANDSNSTTVTVTPQIVAVNPVTPTGLVLTASTSQTFSSTVTGAFNAGITWTASGGTMNPSTGAWLAPGTVGTYTITATSQADGTKVASTSVGVVAAPVAAITAPSQAPSGATGLTASVQSQPGFTYLWTISGGTITSATNANPITFTAGAVGTLTLGCTVTNNATTPASAIGSASVNVIAAPVINSFTPTPDTVLTGGAVTLSFSYSGGTGVITPGNLSVPSTGTVTVNPAVTTTYTLTVTPPVGPAITQTTLVTVGTLPVFSTNLPTSQSVALGTSSLIFTVVTSGTPAVPTNGYQWYFNNSLIGGATGSTYTLTNITSGMAGNYYVAATNSLGTTNSNTLALTVTTNHNISGNVQLANGGGMVNGALMTLSNTATPPVIIQTQNTDSNGNFTLMNIPDGPYTLTPSITGASASGFFPATQSLTVTGADLTNINFRALLGYTVNGHVYYSGGKTGRVYLTLNGNGGASNGVSIVGPAGDFSIRGVPPGTYTLTAFMDTVGLGNANASDPSATGIPVTVGFAAPSGTSVNLTDPSAVSLSTAPIAPDIIPFNGGAIVNYTPLANSGVETATSYDVRWSTDNTFGTVLGTASFKAQGDKNPIFFTAGLSDGSTYYFEIRGNAGASQSPWSPAGHAQIGAATGFNSVSGTITLPVTPTGPLAVVVVPAGKGAPFVTWIASPTQTQAYTITGVPNGTYQLIALLDQNHNGVVDPGDPNNTGENNLFTFTVAGNLTGQNLTLSGANSVAAITTQHYISTSGSSTGEGYQLNYKVNGNLKLPVNVALQFGSSSFVDVGVNSGGDRFQYWVPSAQMNVGDSYNVPVVYSDLATETLTPQVTGVLAASAFAQTLAPTGTGLGNITPTFTWAAPAAPPAGGYTYQFWIWGPTGNIWQVPGNNSNSSGLPSTTTSLVWGVDPTDGTNLPSPSSLTIGSQYTWTISVQDTFGNSGQQQVTYTP